MGLQYFVEAKLLQETWLVEINIPIWDDPVVFRVDQDLKFTAVTEKAEELLKDADFMDMIAVRLKHHMTRYGDEFPIVY